MAATKITLREATWKDLDFLYNASTLGMEPVSDILDRGRIHNEEKRFSEYKVKFEPEKINVVQFEGQDVGRLRVVRSDLEIYIGGIQLLPEFQRRGIGTSVLKELIQESNQLGIPIKLEVHKVNQPAINFYNKLGFKTIDQTEKQYIMKYNPLTKQKLN